MNVIDCQGYCPICESTVQFTSKHDWFRDHLLCSDCGSIPRERAVAHVLTTYYSEYRELDIHESSPGGRGLSPKLKAKCLNYSTSHYFPSISRGQLDPVSGFQCQNLEELQFRDETFDLFITQDVMEHIFDPAKAFQEIARVLKPGGAHIFTVPLVNKSKASEVRATVDIAGIVQHLLEPEYHGNPIDEEGSLVTRNWGYDIAEFIQRESGMPSTIIMIDDMSLGIRAEFIEVIVSRKY